MKNIQGRDEAAINPSNNDVNKCAHSTIQTRQNGFVKKLQAKVTFCV